MLALGIATPGIAVAQGDGRPPFPADFRGMHQRESDDIALLLALRPAQRPALAAYLRSLLPPLPPQNGALTEDGPLTEDGALTEDGPMTEYGPMTQDDRPSPDDDDAFARHLERMTAALRWRSADGARRIAAARTFYDGLDPAQRAAFEALMRVRYGPPMMPGEPMPGGPPRDGPPDRPPPPGDLVP